MDVYHGVFIKILSENENFKMAINQQELISSCWL